MAYTVHNSPMREYDIEYNDLSATLRRVVDTFTVLSVEVVTKNGIDIDHGCYMHGAECWFAVTCEYKDDIGRKHECDYVTMDLLVTNGKDIYLARSANSTSKVHNVTMIRDAINAAIEKFVRNL